MVRFLLAVFLLSVVRFCAWLSDFALGVSESAWSVGESACKAEINALTDAKLTSSKAS
jgi:hypothetical protein